MTQRDRDRLVELKKGQKKLITQSQAAKELDVSERQVRRLLMRLRETGDKSGPRLTGHRYFVRSESCSCRPSGFTSTTMRVPLGSTVGPSLPGAKVAPAALAFANEALKSRTIRRNIAAPGRGSPWSIFWPPSVLSYSA